MAEEKKGFMSRLFGRGKAPEEPTPEEPPAEQVTEEPTLPTPLPDLEPAGAETEQPEQTEDIAEQHVRAEATPEPAAPEPQPAQEPEPQKKRGFFRRLTEGLSRTSSRIAGGVSDIFTKKKLDEETLEELEDLLISADLGLAPTERVINRLRKERVGQDVTDEEVKAILSEVVADTLTPLEKPLTVNSSNTPHVILVVGVNGAGKTTTIGKLASKFKAEGHSVLLAAGDTFRAAAVEQLAVWGERSNVPVLTKPNGADAAGLAYEAIEKARAEKHDVILIDTAGRLQNRSELMDELAKIVRVIKKLAPEAPHDTLLVLDATVGQNAISQAQTFTEIAGVTGLVMTKLDGTARGGILCALGDKFALPIHFIGIGEGIDDLRAFNALDFANALTSDE